VVTLQERDESEEVSFPDPSKGGVSVAVIVRAKPPSPADAALIVSMTKKSTTITLPYRKNKVGALRHVCATASGTA
jgi:hypothetical protein